MPCYLLIYDKRKVLGGGGKVGQGVTWEEWRLSNWVCSLPQREPQEHAGKPAPVGDSSATQLAAGALAPSRTLLIGFARRHQVSIYYPRTSRTAGLWPPENSSQPAVLFPSRAQPEERPSLFLLPPNRPPHYGGFSLTLLEETLSLRFFCKQGSVGFTLVCP